MTSRFTDALLNEWGTVGGVNVWKKQYWEGNDVLLASAFSIVMNIVLLLLHKTGSAGPVKRKINLVSPNVLILLISVLAPSLIPPRLKQGWQTLLICQRNLSPGTGTVVTLPAVQSSAEPIPLIQCSAYFFFLFFINLNNSDFDLDSVSHSLPLV